MLSEKDVALVYDTLLSSPGMNEVVKLDLRISRKRILLLAHMIQTGVLSKKGEGNDGLLQSAGTGLSDELAVLANELLEKAGLTEMAVKLQSLHAR